MTDDQQNTSSGDANPSNNPTIIEAPLSRSLREAAERNEREAQHQALCRQMRAALDTFRAEWDAAWANLRTAFDANYRLQNAEIAAKALQEVGNLLTRLARVTWDERAPSVCSRLQLVANFDHWAHDSGHAPRCCAGLLLEGMTNSSTAGLAEQLRAVDACERNREGFAWFDFFRDRLFAPPDWPHPTIEGVRECSWADPQTNCHRDDYLNAEYMLQHGKTVESESEMKGWVINMAKDRESKNRKSKQDAAPPSPPLMPDSVPKDLPGLCCWSNECAVNIRAALLEKRKPSIIELSEIWRELSRLTTALLPAKQAKKFQCNDDTVDSLFFEENPGLKILSLLDDVKQFEPKVSAETSENISNLVSQIYADRPSGLDDELADAFVAVATGIRECSRLIASLPHLWTNEREYLRLAQIVAEAAQQARAAYFRVDIRLRRVGGLNPMLSTLNDVLTVAGLAPTDPTHLSALLNPIIVRLMQTRSSLFLTVDGKGCIDRMLDQLAHVPPVVNPIDEGRQKEVGGVDSNPCEGKKKSSEDSKRIPREEAEIRVSNWLLANAKTDPDSITRDAVAAGTGVSGGAVSKTPSWIAFRKRRDSERQGKIREVPLSDKMATMLESDPEISDELAELMEEQARDEAEQNRRHRHS